MFKIHGKCILVTNIDISDKYRYIRWCKANVNGTAN